MFEDASRCGMGRRDIWSHKSVHAARFKRDNIVNGDEVIPHTYLYK